MKINDIREFVFFFVTFLLLYTTLDFLNQGGYYEMYVNSSILIVMMHVILNIVISFIAAYTQDNAKVINLQRKNLTNLSVAGLGLGIITFGCTPCVVSFFLTFGITITLFVSPVATLFFKIIALLITICGYIITKYYLSKYGCKIKR
jgi:hypothetical protein